MIWIRRNLKRYLMQPSYLKLQHFLNTTSKHHHIWRWKNSLLINKTVPPVSTIGEYCSRVRRRQWHPTPVLLSGKSHGQRSLVGCSPWGREESDMTERLHFHFSLSCIGEGNGNPVQCSWLENPRWGSLVGCRLWDCTESDMTEAI